MDLKISRTDLYGFHSVLILNRTVRQAFRMVP